ncbi:MAG: histidine kinase [Oscillospiraceae bacterium]|nr:histidine kinase [Oscillospiraceae bacterium]MDD4546527.1 histidine kinase [Oscillospiraceae bacterium]
MWPILDKLLLLLGGFLLVIIQRISVYSVITLLVGVSVSALSDVFNQRKFSLAAGISYAVLCFFHPEFNVFLPLVFYHVFMYNVYPLYAVAIIPLITARGAFTQAAPQTGIIFFMLIASFMLCRHSMTNRNLKAELMRQRDSGQETALLLESRNKDLIEKQDVEIHLATLAERNRIAREIHDNVGHMLSRSILQLGALKAVNMEPTTGDGLNVLHNTLSDAMDSIRRSVHNLYDESIDLNAQVLNIIRKFTYCPVKLDYDIESSMGRSLKYTFLSIIREALSNIARHSDATQVNILLKEHPGFFQLIIQDNGQGCKSSDSPNGIGLQNMHDRIAVFDGNMNIDKKNGYKLFISIPKGEKTK